MGKADISERDFLKDNYIFADAVNYRLFDGEQATYVVIALEAQTEVNYAMPARCMLYDALEYKSQIDKLTSIHRAEDKQKKKSNGGFLSGLYITDRLKPVITLVIFFSPDEWDGPLSIYDMLETDDPKILAFVENYKIHLISPKDMEQDDFGLLKTDLREVLECIKYSNDKEKLYDYVHSNERMHNLDYKAAYTISAATNTKWSFLVNNQKEGGIDMCKAIDDLIKDGIEKGEALVFASGFNEGEQSGFKQLQSLINILLGNNRIDDLRRVAEDDGYRNDLLREYNLV